LPDRRGLPAIRQSVGVLASGARTNRHCAAHAGWRSGPWAQILDFSLQKSFRIGEGKRRLQFRADGLNLLNHPVFRVFPQRGRHRLYGRSEYRGPIGGRLQLVATANNQPQSTTTAGTALLTQINNMVNAQKNALGVLPPSFFSTALAANFFGKAASSFDITTLAGFKQFRLRQAYNNAFGDLYQRGGARYIQLGLKLYF